MNELTGVDLEALTAWAESDAPLIEQGTELRGDAAAKAGQKALRRAGRPALGQDHSTGQGRSPRRQVRLPASLNDRLDNYSHRHGVNSSDVIREALTNYLDRIGA